MSLNLEQHPHRRFNPLTQEWVLVSPHRTKRPWQGKQEDPENQLRPEYDENCYLCPGNQRSEGQLNPDYQGIFVFTNDFPALLPDTPQTSLADDPLFKAESEQGKCKVICFSPRHDLSVPGMSLGDVTRVIAAWKKEYEAFRSDPDIEYVQIFENKGAIMGCSNPHPHCQIWSSSSLPSTVLLEHESQKNYAKTHGIPMLVDYLRRELEKGQRIVYQNDHFVVLVPFWAIWPFEAMILPRRHIPSIDCFTDSEMQGFADAYRTLTRTYDKVFSCEFPYTAGIHQAPARDENFEFWQLHMHFYPPLLRSSTVKKFMVGYEMLASPQRDITAESSAETLRLALKKAGQS